MKSKMGQFSVNLNPIFSVAKNGTVLYSNEASEPLLQEWGTGIGEKLPSSIVDIVQSVISRNSPEKIEVKVGNKLYLVVFSPLPEQELVSISGFDISDQKKSEEETKVSEKRLKALMDNNPSLIFMKDECGRYVYLNRAYEKKFVLSKGWYEKTDFDFWPNESAELFRANDSLVLKSGKTHQFMEDSNDLNGTRFCWLNYKFPFIDSKHNRYVGGIGIDVTDRIRAEEALKENETKYRTLFNSLDAGFCIIEVLFNDAGNPVDYIFFEANPAFVKQTGLVDAIGKRMRDLNPAHEEHWFEIYGEIARTGKPRRFVESAMLIGGWYEVYAFPIGKPGANRVAVLFSDITEQIKADEILRKSKERQDFLLKLSDALRLIVDPAEVQSVAARLLGEHLGANQVHYGETVGDVVIIHQGYGNGLSPMIGSFRHRDFSERLIATYRSGKTAVCCNVDTDPTITKGEAAVITGSGFRAYIAVPLLKDGNWVATLAAHSIEPREWTPEEVALVEEVAERTWAAVERARAEEALRSSEEKFRILSNTLEERVKERTVELEKAYKSLKEINTVRKQEIHHRIKNNLQVISSLLDLQADKFRDKKNIEDSQVLEAFKESQDRVISMALIHEELHKGGEIDTLNFSAYIQELADNLFLSYRLGNDGISLDMGIEEDILLDMDTAVPLGMIVNELVSNSLKHAFSDRDKGEIRIKLHREENGESDIEDCCTAFILSVSDNGIGISKDFEIEDIDSLGLQLVTTLVDQLDGKLELRRDNGTEFIVMFSIKERNNQANSPTYYLIE